jgi:cytochrome c-type biogenesis protein CcmH
MSGFIFLALGLLVMAGAALAWPLLRPRPSPAPVPAPIAAVAAILAVIAGSAVVYSRLGSPGSALPQAAAAADSVAALARHLESSPDDTSGWLQLGAAYSQIEQFPLAIRAYSRANRLAGESSPQALVGIGEAMLLSGDAQLGARASQYLERALQLAPANPKALFYSAVIAYRQDRLDVARERFAGLLALSPPDNVRAAVQKELADIDARLHPVIDEATAIHLHVTLAPSLAARVPADAALFVFVPAPGGGPPLAVKRNAASVPQDVVLSAADSMMPGHAIQAGQKVSVVARISASGSPLPTSGDLSGQIDYVVGKSGARALEINKLNP